MAEWRELAPHAGLGLPLETGGCRLSALVPGPITAVAPFPGQAGAVAERLGGFPAPGEALEVAAGQLVWAGRETAFLFGAAPDLSGLAAVTEQSDGWGGLRLTGEGAAEVLARLVPIDLQAMAPPASVRTLLNHMPLLLICAGKEDWQLWSYRSMAGTMVEELSEAMRNVAARATLA